MTVSTASTYPRLETARLRLRGFRPDDAETVEALAGNIAIARTTLNIPHPYEPGMALGWISTHQDEFQNGTGVVFAITDKHRHTLMGAIGLVIVRPHARAELGYWIGEPYWGNGYCTEAALEMLSFGFETLKLHRITASHFVSNPASGRVMQKIGMRQEGLRPQHYIKWDEFIDAAQYGILRSDWLARRT